jgi:hypothetical protein
MHNALARGLCSLAARLAVSVSQLSIAANHSGDTIYLSSRVPLDTRKRKPPKKLANKGLGKGRRR